MPQRIALIGAPTSGKTELAQQLREALLPRSFQCIDGYVEKLSEQTNQAFSHYANYLGNCQVAIARWQHEIHTEDILNPDGGLDVRVTCGTIVESTVYAALHAIAEQNSGLAPGTDRRAAITMAWLGVMAYDTWVYDHAFYLPLPDGADQWDRIVDQHIPEAAETLSVNLTELPMARDERVGKVLEAVVSSEEANGRGVQPSGEPGGTDANPVGSVSDVRE